MITIKEMAEMLAISTTTVSNVINGKTSEVSQKTAEKVQKLLDEYDYVPNMNAKNLAQNHSRLIGIVLKRRKDKYDNIFTDPFHGELLGALEAAIRERGYYMMIYLASLMSVPQDLYEACDIDGASFFRKHLTVTVPHLMPTIALVSTISAISAMKVFAEIYVMTKGGPLNSSKTIVYYIYERAFENLDLGYASALSVVLLLVVLAFSIINVVFFEKNRYQI